MDFKGRAAWEEKFAKAIHSKLNGQTSTLLGYLGDPPDESKVPDSFWEQIGADLKPVILKHVKEIYAESAADLLAEFKQQAVEAGIDVAWDLPNKAAADWAKNYTDQLVQQLYKSNIDGTSELVSDFYQNGWTMGDLTSSLQELFGEKRAEMIAVTETTRAAVEGERGLVGQIEDETGWDLPEIWQTEKDELVCDICGPLQGKEKGADWDDSDGPPAHPRCRCWTTHELPDLEKVNA
jgi:hypothetical protein